MSESSNRPAAYATTIDGHRLEHAEGKRFLPGATPSARYELHYDQMREKHRIERVEVLGEFDSREAARDWMIVTTADREARDRGVSVAVRALAEFHAHPNSLHEGTNTQALRRTLQAEEHHELMDELAAAACGHGDLGQLAREIADVLYVTYGTAWAFGIDADAAFAEVHRAAMDKIRAGLRREDGKILKPPGFVPPNMAAAVAEAHLEPREVTRAS